MKARIKPFALILLLCMLCGMSVTASAAVSRKTALAAARKKIPASCRLVKAEQDRADNEWEFKFLSKNRKTKYEVTVYASNGKVKKAEMEKRYDRGGKSVKISASKAKKAVKKLFGGCTIRKVVKKRDDGRYIFRIRFSSKSFTGKAEVNAETGKVIEWEKKYR